jgi:hypothetical protein
LTTLIKERKRKVKEMVFLDSDLAYPSEKTEAQKHKRRRLVQGPNSEGCYQVQTVQTDVKIDTYSPCLLLCFGFNIENLSSAVLTTGRKKKYHTQPAAEGSLALDNN